MSSWQRSYCKGGSTGPAPFLMLPQWAFDSPAFRSLKPGPRAVLWEVIRRYNGANNGHIGFSQREMSAAINVADRETVAGYVRDLKERGFINAVRRGGFNVKAADRRASEWALTWLPVGEAPATKEFMRWQPEKKDGTEKPATKDGKAVPKVVSAPIQSSNVWNFPSPPRSLERLSGTEKPSTYTSLAIGDAPTVCCESTRSLLPALRAT